MSHTDGYPVKLTGQLIWRLPTGLHKGLMLDAAIPTLDHAIQQDPAFYAALRLCGQKPLRLPGGLTLLSRRLMGIPLAMLPRATPPHDLSAQLKTVGWARRPVILSPERPIAQMQGFRVRPSMKVATIDLACGTDARRASLHSKWRNQLCRAEDGPLRIRSARIYADHPLMRLEEQQARLRRYINWPRALTSAFAQAAPDQTRLFTAYIGGAPVSYMLFLLHGNRATYHIGYTSDEGRVHNAHNLLLWTATRWLDERNYHRLDLGYLHPNTHTLNRFKLRSGAQVHETGGTWVYWNPLFH